MIPFVFRQCNRRMREESGSVLASVLLVTGMLMLIFLSALTFMSVRYSVQVKESNRAVAAALARSGINHALAHLSDGFEFDAPVTRRVIPDGHISVKTSAWGPYLLILAEGRKANQSVRSTAIVGSEPDPRFDAAVIVCDERYPVTVAGNTRIQGNVITGPLGLTTGRLHGQTPVREDFHTGRVVPVASLSPPVLDRRIMTVYIESVDARRSAAQHRLVGSQHLIKPGYQWLSPGQSMSIEENLSVRDWECSAGSERTSCFAGGRIEIKGASHISGLAEVVADGPISLQDSSWMESGLLYSRDSIVIEHDSYFQGIAVSHTAIVVRGSARTGYPASLILIPSGAGSDSPPAIWLQSKRPVESVVFAGGSLRTEDSLFSRLGVDTGSILVGLAVSQDVAEVKGRVDGALMTERFLIESPPTSYVNWLANATVNRHQLNYLPALPVCEGLHGQSFRLVSQRTWR